MYSSVFRSVLFPALELHKGTNIQQRLAVLRKTQWWSKAQIEELQNKQLKALVRHAYDNVPYYHRIFSQNGITPSDIKTKKDLKKIPVLTTFPAELYTAKSEGVWKKFSNVIIPVVGFG